MSIAGRYNSSITRVRPFFQYLISKDDTGKSWLPAFLFMFPNFNNNFTNLQNIGTILPELTKKSEFRDKILERHGIRTIELKRCFEYSLPPTRGFLRWLIKHPDSLHPPKQLSRDKGKQQLRENLLNKNGPKLQEIACQTALQELEKKGPMGSGRQWWAFEGFTEVDCYLETSELILLIEGKRTENLSRSVSWYPHRNQLIRNLEAAKGQAEEKGKRFAVGVLSEKPEPFPSDQEIANSLPHYTIAERTELITHYLGNILWKDLCKGLDIPLDVLPESIEDILQMYKKVF